MGIAVVGLCGSIAAAQQSAKRNSTILGVALDSLHGRPLAGAEVLITEVTRAVVTDSLGRFRVDSLPAGVYQVALFHPVLDSLGISLSSPQFTLGPDSATLIRLSVPSAATLIGETCKMRLRAFGNSTILGRVLDPETYAPVPHAEVSVGWVQYDAAPGVGIKQTPRLVRDSTDASGVFRICGLPPDLDARLQVNYHGVKTADVPVSTTSSGEDFIIRPLFVPRADTSGTRAGKATVTGKVTLAGGQPAVGSRVDIVGSKAAALVDENGDFIISGAPSGTQMILVRKLGWEAREVAVDLSASRPQKINVQLKKYVPMMDPVVVTARSERALDKVGFNARKRSGMGYYLTASDIAKHNPTLISDVLRTVPGLSVREHGLQTTIVSTRGTGLSGTGCINYFVDGSVFPNLGGSANEFIGAPQVAAIEVYQPFVVPPEFTSVGGSQCTAIVIWTKGRVGIP